MKRKVVVPVIVVLSMVAVVGGAWLWLRKGDVPDLATLELQGNVEVREVRSGFQVAGRILKLLVDEGNAVKPGQVLAELEPGYFEDAVKQAEAALAARKAELLRLKNGSRPEEIAQARATTLSRRVAFLNAQREFTRNQKLVGSGAVSRHKFDHYRAALDEAEAQLRAAEAYQKLVELGPRKEDIARTRALVEQAQAKLAEARRRLRDCRLLSPVSGIIQTRVHEPGDYVNVGEPVFTITLPSPVWVRVYVSELQLGRIHPGMTAMVRTDTYPDHLYQGR
ncbi:MAG: HlyD family efflux transporter periplasmic adaptor subunit, partial [Deltaproteobacteria bacterium]|nr:HlyD family efflux transporter periplasmic adaptor subunit [Deltaproteobacteria bacterium]